MEFKLILAPTTRNDCLLKNETVLNGLNLVMVAANCLRRNLDGNTNIRHQALGTINEYSISVPQAIAVESGWYETSNEMTILVPNNFLRNYIFYMANMNTVSTRRSCYPYYQNSIVVTSYIDELAVLDTWKKLGYGDKIKAEDIQDGAIDTSGGCGCGCGGTSGVRYALDPLGDVYEGSMKFDSI